MYRLYNIEFLQASIQKGNKTAPTYKFGVSMYPLFKINPERIVIPLLHCEMGLLNKFNEWFQDWILLWVEELPEELEMIQRAYIDATMAT
jgi:hypothetical protein